MLPDSQGPNQGATGALDADEPAEHRPKGSTARTDRRHELRVYLSDRDQRMIDRLRKDLDCSASDLTRSALRDLWLKIHGRPFR